jgi:benzil reductase ((S)-benzoin forming)
MWSSVMRKEEERREESSRFTILSIQPGVVDTAMQDKIRDTSESDFPMVKKFHKLKEEGKLFKPEDVAQALFEIIEKPDSIPDWQHRIQ